MEEQGSRPGEPPLAWQSGVRTASDNAAQRPLDLASHNAFRPDVLGDYAGLGAFNTTPLITSHIGERVGADRILSDNWAIGKSIR